MPAIDSTLSTFTASDGDNLAVQHWCARADRPRRGAVVLVHGLGEHAGRYERLAGRLTSWGFDVHGYDQCGHGESSGRRGRLPKSQRLLQDLQDVIESIRARLPADEPLIVLGHSMGALEVASLLLESDVPVDGVVLSSPAFGLRLGRVQEGVLRLLARFAPNLTVSNRIPPEALSHDTDVVEAFRRDPLVHRRISGRLAQFLVETGPQVLAQAGRWRWPTLLVYAGSDVVVDPRVTRQFVEATPPGMVRPYAFKSLFHEVFNELEAEPVYAALQRWLQETFPPRASASTATPRQHRRDTPATPSPNSAGSSPAW